MELYNMHTYLFDITAFISRFKKYSKDLTEIYPRVFDIADICRRNKSKIANWKGCTYVPIDFLLQGMLAVYGQTFDDTVTMLLTNLVATFAGWRLTKGVYKFHPDLFDELWTPVKGMIPVDVLYTIPEYVLYIAFPRPLLYYNRDVYGAWVWVDHVIDNSSQFTIPSIAMIIDYSDIPRSARFTLADMQIYERMSPYFDKENKERDQELADFQNRIVNLLLYIISENADIKDAEEKKYRPKRPIPLKTRKGERFFASNKYTVWEVGADIGEMLLREKRSEIELQGNCQDEDKERVSPRPHVRRGHFHHFWTGKREDPERKLVLKWIHPMLVSAPEEGSYFP